MKTSQNKKRRIRDWKSGINSSEKKLVERLPVVGTWFWKLRVYGELRRYYKEAYRRLSEAGKRGAAAGEKCREQTLSGYMVIKKPASMGQTAGPPTELEILFQADTQEEVDAWMEKNSKEEDSK